MNKIGRGLTRIWLVFIGLIELGIALACVLTVNGWLSGDRYGAFYRTNNLHDVIAPFILWMSGVAIVAYFIWWVAGWIARGFSD